MSHQSRAFFKGGCGCLIAFVSLGVLIAFTGGRVRITCGGAALLFLVGGVIGLVALTLFKKAPREGEVTYSQAPPRSRVWTCVNCGSDNNPAASTCRNCNEPR